jgi:hypothetical protein
LRFIRPSFLKGRTLIPSGGDSQGQVKLQGVKLNGVDIITWNAAGQITHFKVMIRPLKAVNLLHQLMGAELAKAAG